MRIALAQLDTTVGDFDGNRERIVRAARQAAAAGAGLVVCPELALCGYMPRDLLEEEAFLAACERALERLAAEPGLPALLLGAPLRALGAGKPLLHAAVLVRDGATVAVAKRLLPTYDVFDERRYFRPGASGPPVEVGGVRIGVTVCEDIWTGSWSGDQYAADPVADLVAQGAELILNVSASPYVQGKPGLRRRIARGHVERHRVPMALCNLVGANDQLVFDGNSFAMDRDGTIRAHAAAFATETVVVDFSGPEVEPPAEEVRDAVVLGIRDYFSKTGFERAIVGMSGGIDSALTACLAVDALGAECVTGVGLPGPFSAGHSLDDARELAGRLGHRFLAIPITGAYELARRTLGEVWGDRPFDETEENLQARLRGLYLMALANRERALVLVPSNKSEFAMGYCTLYGDMVGALAPISDLYKTEVYAMARRCYAETIPARVLERAPSAELRPGQTDQDSLPPYDVLDEILRLHLEERLHADAIAARGLPRDVAVRVLRTVSLMEYKRQQAAPVLKLTPKAFGLGRRFPIVERFHGGTV